MQNLLKTYRRKTEITLGDISQLLSMQDSSTLSRCERGSRRPNLEIIFTYHLLFEAPIKKLFEQDLKGLLIKLKRNLEPIISALEKQQMTKKIRLRILFLNSLKDKINKKYE